MNFLDIEVVLHSNNTIETDIYYKDANAHDYLPYNSAHSKHCKDNLPSLAIICSSLAIGRVLMSVNRINFSTYCNSDQQLKVSTMAAYTEVTLDKLSKKELIGITLSL